jgi:hypothetical protein
MTMKRACYDIKTDFRMKNTMKPKRAAWMLLLLSLMAATIQAQTAG